MDFVIGGVVGFLVADWLGLGWVKKALAMVGLAKKD